MAMTQAQLQELSRLLDTLQALPETARARWVDTLGPEQDVYRPALAQLLAADSGVETRDFLQTLPKLDEPLAAMAGGLAAGMEIGPYRLLRELGRGGMGAVWLAERSDGALKRQVALKLPHSALAQRQLAERFARERDILSGLVHPHIARLYDAGVSPQGQPYLALEYVEGEPLLAWCDARKLPVRARIGLFRQVLSAVQYAHGQLVVHRDLKPSNILVTAQGEVRLLDFGIAKLLTDGEARETELTQIGGRALTPHYASPEQILGLPIGTASDVYGLGVVLFELLAGAMPYRVTRDSRGALEDAVLSAEPAWPSEVAGDAAAAARSTTRLMLARELGGDLDTIVLKALKKKPVERYATVDALAADLDRFLAGEPVLARPDSRWYRARKFVGRHRLAVGAALTVVLALGVGIGVAIWQAGIAREQAALAREETRSSRAIHQFLSDIFTANSSNQADPQKARQTTARELLDIGAARIDTQLKDAPEARAAVLRIVSDMYAELGLNDRAAVLAEQRVALLRSRRGPDHPDIADQLVEISQMIQQTNRSVERGPLLKEALRILELHPESDRKTLVRALRQIALLEYSMRDPGALDHARQAAALAESIGATGELLESLIVMGTVQSRAGDNAGAEKTLVRALELFAELPAMHRRRRVFLLAYLGDAEFALGKIAAAEGHFREGLDLALKVSGPDHIDAAQMEKRLGEILYESARTREGLGLVASGRERIIRVAGANNTSLLPLYIKAEGAMRAEMGDPEAAAPLVAQGLRLLATAGRDRSRASLLLLQAGVAMDLGRTEEAQAALEHFDADARAGRLTVAGEREDRLLQGVRVMVALDRREEARAELARMQEKLAAPAQTFEAWRSRLQWGEVALALADPASALALARRALDQIAAAPDPRLLELREQTAAALAGRAHLALDDAAAAVPLLRRAVALAETHFDPARSLRLAQVLLELAEADRRVGNAVEARQARARAQAILARHPGLGARMRRA